MSPHIVPSHHPLLLPLLPLHLLLVHMPPHLFHIDSHRLMHPLHIDLQKHRCRLVDHKQRHLFRIGRQMLVLVIVVVLVVVVMVVVMVH